MTLRGAKLKFALVSLLVKGEEMESPEGTESFVIEVENLVKIYCTGKGRVQALRGISFRVRKGEIFTIVGPNGAGKTTTLECIEGLRKPTSGTVKIFGQTVWDDGQEGSFAVERDVKRRIGVQLQDARFPLRLKICEVVRAFLSIYGVDENKCFDVLRKVELTSKAHALIKNISGGQYQRLRLAVAIGHDPEIVFLDEPTTGLDPHARRALWDIIKALKHEGKTVVLTTHYMEEAQHLSDRVAIINRGEIVALDSPSAIIEGTVGRGSLEDAYLALTGERFSGG